jgi:hypothetical protein
MLIYSRQTLLPEEVLMGEEDDDDDDEIEYGKLYVHTPTTNLDEIGSLLPLKGDDGELWPHWSEGVPKKLRRKLSSDPFTLGNVRHHYREYFAAVEFKWNDRHKLSFLRENYNYLPSGGDESEWSGVYRIFLPDMAIDRFCGKDPTGTLYLGRAGGVGRNWSILRTRIMAIAKREHHATRSWDYNEVIRNKYPWESLAIEWAYTGKSLDYKGETVATAPLAEAWLLICYNDSYGELPPLNQKA